MQEYDWPGNVRELQHTIEKAVILSDNHIIEPSDLFLRPIKKDKNIHTENLTLEEMERVLIERCMADNENNISAVAKDLGISRPTLYSKIKKYGL